MWFERSSWEHPKINQNVEWNSACLEEKGIRASSNEEGSITFRQLARPPVHSLLAGQRALQFKQLFSSQTPHTLRDPPRPSWKLVLGSVRQVRGFQMEFSDALHPTFTYLETRTARKLARHHWPTSSLECDTRNSSRMLMLFD